MSFVSINPATGERLATYRAHTDAQLAAIVDRSHNTFEKWSKLTPTQRARPLRALAKALLANQASLAALLTAEVGKPITQSLREIEKCANVCEYYAEHGPDFLATEHPVAAPENTHVEFAPLGIVLAIMPWNFPFWQVFRAAAPAFMAGNSVILKHAANVSGCALAIEKICASCGLPSALLQTVLIAPEKIAGLIADPRVRAVTMTGSTAAGKKVAALAGAAMKPGIYELGGSDPALILADADISLAARVSAHSRLINTGQSCVATKRFIVVRSVLKAFEKALVEAVAAHRVGDPNDPATQVGPVARLDRREALHGQVSDAVSKGARVLLGGEDLPGAGYFFAPTVVTQVKPGMAVYREEVFGPVAIVIPVRDEAQAIAVANDTAYGLGAAIFTRNRRRGRALAAQLDCGLVFINAYARSDLHLPFGGTKESGHGRELGVWGLRAFVNTKSVWVD